MGGVMILGGGVAGLGCAMHLPGARLFEAAGHPGGHAYSHPQGGVCFDQGAHISHSRDEDFIALTDRAAGDVVRMSRSVVKNHWSGRWMTYPVQNNLRELPLSDRIQALTDLVLAHAEKADSSGSSHPRLASYRDWCLAQYGEHLTKNFYDVFTTKYWRVPAQELATDWLAGRLLPSMLPRIVHGAFDQAEESQAVFAKFRYPAQGGFFSFFAPLYEGLDLHLNERAVEIDARRKLVTFASGRKEIYEALASSIPLPTLIGILKDVPTELRAAADCLRATRLLCVNLIVKRPRLTDAHWFYIYDHDIEAARVSVPSNLAPDSVPAGHTALQAELFRLPGEPMPVDDLVETVTGQLGRMLDFNDSDLVHVGHVLAPRAYIVSDQRRGPAVEALLGWLEQQGIWSMGLYGRWKYVWSDEAFRQGRETALALQALFSRRRSG